MANHAHCMGVVDIFTANLQIINTSLADLDAAIKDIAGWHTRFEGNPQYL